MPRQSCVLEDLVIRFQESGFAFNPISVTLQQNKQRDDYFSATLTRIAGRELSFDYKPREPVTFEYGGVQVWRGWIKHGDLSLMQNKAQVRLRDSREILESGAVDFEKIKAQLLPTVEEIVAEAHDPYNVITGTEATDNADGSQTRYQHGEGNYNETAATEYSRAVNDTLKEIIPVSDGDGDFDFRDDNARSALSETCAAFNVGFFVTPDGTLKIGFPDAAPNQYMTGVTYGERIPWKLTKYNVPDEQQPIGRVIVTGKERNSFEIAKDEFLPSDQTGSDLDDAALAFVSDMDAVTTMAEAKFAGYTGPTHHIENSSIHNSEALKQIARNYLMNTYMEQRSGRITVSAIADGRPAEVGPLKIGDYVLVQAAPDCGVPGGNFRINSIKHTIDSSGTWDITMDVIHPFPSEIVTDSWEYSPNKPDQNVNTLPDMLNVWGQFVIMQAGPGLLMGATLWDDYEVDPAAETAREIEDFLGNIYDQVVDANLTDDDEESEPPESEQPGDFL